MNTTFDYSFFNENEVYRYLTRAGGHMESLHNIEYLMNQTNLEAYLDYPEIPLPVLKYFFECFEVIQDGKLVSLEEYNSSKEALAIKTLKNKNYKDVFLVRPAR